MISFKSLLKRHTEIAVLLLGLLSLLIIPPIGLFFAPPFSVFASYLLLMLVSLVRRPQDRAFSIAASSALAVIGFYWYFRSYLHWNSLGLILHNEMPIATLAISLPAALVLLVRRLKLKPKAH